MCFVHISNLTTEHIGGTLEHEHIGKHIGKHIRITNVPIVFPNVFKPKTQYNTLKHIIAHLVVSTFKCRLPNVPKPNTHHNTL